MGSARKVSMGCSDVGAVIILKQAAIDASNFTGIEFPDRARVFRCAADGVRQASPGAHRMDGKAAKALS